MGSFSMKLAGVLLLAFVVPVVLLAAEARPPLPAVLNLESTLQLKSEAVEHLMKRDMARHGRRGLLGEDQGTNPGIVQLPVSGSMEYYTGWPYLTHVKLGNPAKDFTLLIDTGSGILWVSCNPCSDCPSSNGIRNSYDPSQSRTSSVLSCSDEWCQGSIRSGIASCNPSDNQNGRCSYDIVYGSGATVGYYVSDQIHLDTVEGTVAGFSSSVIFGCSNFQSGDLAEPNLAFDGILGLAPNEQSTNSQLNSIGVAPMVFSLCLKSGSGILVLGEAVAQGLVYTPFVPSMAYYSVYLESIAVNGQKLAIDPAVFTSHKRSTFVDSGTSLAYLPDEAYNAFLTAIMAAVSLSPSVLPVVNNGQQCFITNSRLELAFPTVTLHFTGGADMIVMPQNYLLPNSLLDGQSMYCMGWKRHPGGPKTILGDIVLMDKLLVFDFENRRFGWANYDCSQPINVTTTNHWNKTSNSWNKRPTNSAHTTYNIIVPTGVSIVVTFILIFGSQYPFPTFV